MGSHMQEGGDGAQIHRLAHVQASRMGYGLVGPKGRGQGTGAGLHIPTRNINEPKNSTVNRGQGWRVGCGSHNIFLGD
jgi:hypothetical protein